MSGRGIMDEIFEKFQLRCCVEGLLRFFIRKKGKQGNGERKGEGQKCVFFHGKAGERWIISSERAKLNFSLSCFIRINLN